MSRLSDEVNAKARELQGLNESVDGAKAKLAELSASERRLGLEMAELEQMVKEKKASLADLTERELAFVAKVEKELSDKNISLAVATTCLEDVKKKLEETSGLLQERQDYLTKTKQAREQYVEEKSKLDLAMTKYEQATVKHDQELALVAKEKKEMGEYKTYLDDFYGKVAGYVIVAKDVVEQTNVALAKGTKLRFKVPNDLLTMDNFNKL